MSSDYDAILDQVRNGISPDMDAAALAALLSAGCTDPDDTTAERAALASYYAEFLPAPVIVPELAALLENPFSVTGDRLRGRLHWIKLMTGSVPPLPATAVEGRRRTKDPAESLFDDDVEPVPEGDDADAILAYAALVLEREKSGFARERVFSFLNNWNQRARAFPFLGTQPLSRFHGSDDDETFGLLRTELYRSAHYAAQKGAAVAAAARRAAEAWLAGTLSFADTRDSLEAASPLLDDFPLAPAVFADLAAAARADPGKKPRFRSLAVMYGIWLMDPSRRESPHSWPEVRSVLAAAGVYDPWSRIAAVRLSLYLAAGADPLPPGDRAALDRELIGLLISPVPEKYAKPACEHALTDFAKTALLDRVCHGVEDGAPMDGAAAAATLAPLLAASATYRVEAAASVLRLLAKHGSTMSAAVPAMCTALAADANDEGSLSSGQDIKSDDCILARGLESPKPFDDVDAPPTGGEGGFMNLDSLTGLLEACMPASTAHRLALGLADALDQGHLDAEMQILAATTLREAAPRNRAAAVWLAKRNAG